jgi:hypothetical protein
MGRVRAAACTYLAYLLHQGLQSDVINRAAG